MLTADELAYFEHFALRSEARIRSRFTIGFDGGMTKPFHIATGGGRRSLDASLAASVGDPYCPSTLNSSGGEAPITAAGSTSIAANDLVLTVQPVPDETCIFFYGPSQIQLPAGDGIRCVGSPRRISPRASAVANVATRHVDLPSVGIALVGTLNFQCWVRDTSSAGAGFNMSNALTVTFTP
ncbi:MAG: hypothetical protein ACI8QZ_003265 [Chlamydiales bacterium]|jgi:hypothetical protein